MSDEKIFADGLIVKRNEKAPDFVLCSLSVKVDEFVQFLNTHSSNGWVNIDCKVSRGGKFYADLNTFKPTQGDAGQQGMEQARAAVEPAISDDDIPF